MKNGILVVIVCIVMAGMAELAARYTDAIGFLSLSFPGNELDRYRTDWHHGREPDGSGVDLWRMPELCTQPTGRVLLAGDSWMREPAFGRALLVALSDELNNASAGAPEKSTVSCIELVNMGTGSYAPSPISIRLANALSEYDAQLILIHIDETDLMDEWIRYKPTLRLDSEGLPVAVSPFLADLPEMVYYAARDVMSGWPSYGARLFGEAFTRAVVLPAFRRLLDRKGQLATYATIMAPHRSQNPEREYAQEVRWFEERVSAMIALARKRAPRTDLVLMSHPHFLHVAGEAHERYTFSVDQILSRLCANSGVKYISAYPSFQEIHGSRFDDTFQWPRDPFSHLTDQAAARYGRWVARVLAADPRVRGSLSRLGDTSGAQNDG